MNIVIFTDAFLPKIDGVGISIDGFCRILSARGHNFVICAPQYGKKDNEIESEENGIRIIRFKNVALPSYPDVKIALPSRKNIKKAMETFPADLIHIQTPGLMGRYGVRVAKTRDLPLIGTYHTLVSEQDMYVSAYRLLKLDKILERFRSRKKIKNRLKKIERKDSGALRKKIIKKLCYRLYESCDLILSPSRRIKEELRKDGIANRIQVLSNGMDFSLFRNRARVLHNPSAPAFLHVGRISHEKNCEIVLKAFALIREKLPRATLSIVGDGPALTSMKIEAALLAPGDSVAFSGFIPHENLPEIYRQHDIYLTASAMETQGLTTLEALGCALPAVGVDAFALPELIVHGKSGFIVQPFDHIAMAARALEILETPGLYERLSRGALEVAGKHELGACADRLEKIYADLIQPDSSGSDYQENDCPVGEARKESSEIDLIHAAPRETSAAFLA